TPASEESSEENAQPEDPVAVISAERDQFKALAQRTQADFINYKRRMEEERGVLARNAANGIIARLLPIVDDLERAIGALPDDAPAVWGDGVRMILQNVQALLQAEGVKANEPAPGEAFDPAEHEAVYYQPTADQPPGTVLTIVRRGYRNQDRVLRPAQVVVAREPEQTDSGSQA
ncbi:MAG: nucleotide exchange factor GrpE, partial [Dehalococcoidia bacterium]